jgi:hypothetical protein
MMAAVLACGPDAVLSHRSAISLWELRPQSGAPFDVAVPGRSHHSRKGIRVHNVRSLDDAERTTRDGIPVTSLHRAILDYADVARPQEVRLAIDAADRLELFDRRKLEALMDRSPTRRGTKKLKAVLAEITGPAPWTRSELERQFLALIRGAGIPEPQANVVVLGYQADLYWPAQRVIAELDGYDFHKSRKSFHGDRRRDTKLLLAGIRTIRITQPRIEGEPAELVRDVQALLSAA